jgi:hypothetical protein
MALAAIQMSFVGIGLPARRKESKLPRSAPLCPELRINPALLDQRGLEHLGFLVGPGSGEVIKIVVELTAGGPLAPGLLQHTENYLVEAQAVHARALANNFLELWGDVAQGDGGHYSSF